MNCKHCKGFVAERFGEQQCLNCGRSTEVPKPPVLFSITYRGNSWQGDAPRYKDYDLERPADKESLVKALKICVGAGLKVSDLTAGKSGLDKGKCRICNRSIFATSVGAAVAHPPSSSLSKNIWRALEQQLQREAKRN